MADSAEIQRKQIDDALKCLVRILARQAAREVFEQQKQKYSEEISSDQAILEASKEQS